MHYPALDVRGDADLLYAVLDDFSPTAIEERGDGLRAFFISSVARDGARAALSSRFKVSAIDVSDEDWARRSQEGLRPVTVGRITIQPGLGIRDSWSHITTLLSSRDSWDHEATMRSRL